MENETREYIRDYLNEVISIDKITKHEKELMYHFNIGICTVGETFELDDDLDYSKHDIRQEEGLKCPDCRNNE